MIQTLPWNFFMQPSLREEGSREPWKSPAASSVGKSVRAGWLGCGCRLHTADRGQLLTSQPAQVVAAGKPQSLSVHGDDRSYRPS